MSVSASPPPLPKRRRPLARVVGGLCLLAVLYLLLWPIDVDPEAWTPAPAPALTADTRLAATEWLARGQVTGPEAIAFDATGRLYAGLLDGRIVRMAAAGMGLETFAKIDGRPLGLKLAANGTLYVADAAHGLLAVTPDGVAALVSDREGGIRFGFTNDLDVAADGTVYFTDASSRYGLPQYEMDIIAHRPLGRLLAFDPRSGSTTKVADGLYFGNGVALAADGAWALVCETSAYRVRRIWLAGPRRGQSEVVVDNLPGFPDNITRSADGHRFWLALASPRDPALDWLAPRPFLRTVVARLPRALRPKIQRYAHVLALDEAGAIVADLQDGGPEAFAPVTSAIEHDGWLYLGSLTLDAIGRVRLP